MNKNIAQNSNELQDFFEKAFSPYDEQEITRLLNNIFDDYSIETRETCLNIAQKTAEQCRVATKFNATLKNFKRDFVNRQRLELCTGVISVVNSPKGYENIFNGYQCGNYIVDDTGIYKVIENKSGDINTIMICNQPLLIVARYRNIDENTEKVVISYTIGYEWNFLTVEREIIASNTKIVRLASSSIDITSETARDIVKYFQYILQVNADKIPIYRTVSRLGWFKGEFVPYSEIILCDAIDNFKDILNQLKCKGNFERWIEHCLVLRQNIYLRLVMAASFAAPLIELVGGLPFVIHLWGGTGTGKTVALCVAASIWGKGAYSNNALVQSFKGTEYALSEKAAFLYSLPVIIDEGQTVKDKESFDILIMNLTEGKGKIQGAAIGGIKKLRHWSNCFITTAEENIIKGNSGGGTSNRVISIEAQHKIIDNGSNTMRIIGNNYGFAGKAFIEHMQSITIDELQSEYDRIYNELQTKTSSTEKQCGSMSILLLADKLSGQCIFKGEKPLTVEDVAPFLTSGKDVDNAERAYDWIINWVSQNINRFKDSNNNNGEVWGKLEKDVAIINKNVLVEHLQCEGFDYGAVMSELARRNRLLLTTQGKYVHHLSTNGIRAYYIKLIITGNEFIDIPNDSVPCEWVNSNSQKSIE